MIKEFRSHGKLMLFGEYAVLKGAKALATPTQFGQSLHVQSSTKKEDSLNWVSKNLMKETWFEAKFDLPNLSLQSSSNVEVAKRLQKMLNFAAKHSKFLSKGSFSITTKTEFPLNFGLGTSSTLINNLGYWANIDPMSIQLSTFPGSGFDVAVAQCDAPILYWLTSNQPNWKKTALSYDFEDELFFVHLNKKAISRDEIKKEISFDKEQLSRITEISIAGTNTKSITEYNELIEEHEDIISHAIGLKKMKDKLFPDFDGSIKSLGAWGGDFIMVTGKDEYVKNYFQSKGYLAIFNYSDIILKG